MTPTAAPAHWHEPSNIKAHPRFIPAKGQPTPASPPDFYADWPWWIGCWSDHRTLAEVDKDNGK